MYTLQMFSKTNVQNYLQRCYKCAVGQKLHENLIYLMQSHFTWLSASASPRSSFLLAHMAIIEIIGPIERKAL